jgi:basic membrane protein A
VSDGGAPPEPARADGEEARSAGAAIRTFLIADVRGYTRFTQERGDEAAGKLAAKFAAVARKGVEARGGVVIELRGDEALAVFSSARQAIRAALFLQELFLEESMADPNLPLLVGIGLDAGEAVEVEAGYRGGALNLAARLCAIAGPGEVLASGEVTHLARRTEGVRYEDRGPVQLKGLSEPVVVIRIISEENDAGARLADLAPAKPPPEEPAAVGGVRAWLSPLRLMLLGAAGIILVAAGLVAANQIRFGVATTQTPPPGLAHGSVSACQLSSGDLNDRSFNQAVYDGLTHAATAYGVTVRAREAQTDSDASSVLKDLVAQKCDLILVLRQGAASQSALIASARANPKQRYALLDPFEAPALPNVLGVAFDVDQSAFLAGYLAAGVSKTGTVATFGALPIPTIIPFMDGFAGGVLKYNIDHHAHVKLIGWDPAGSTGTFMSESDFAAFLNKDLARDIARRLISQGADIIFPVAGPADGSAAIEAARDKGNVLAIGVDVDGFYQSPEYANLWLTSVRKRFDVTVKDAIGLIVSGQFEGGGLLEGTLKNGGVDLAPFHDLDGRVPQQLKDELSTLTAQIVSGKVSVDPRDYLP